MPENKVKLGLTLPNRGVVIGATTVAEMLQLAADAESAGWDSVWVGDSIFAKPRLDAMVLLGAIAARTSVCASDRPASPAHRCATRCCWPTNGPVSTSSPTGAPFSSPVRGKLSRVAVPSKRNLPISGSSRPQDAPDGGSDRDIAPHLLEREHRLQRTILAVP